MQENEATFKDLLEYYYDLLKEKNIENILLEDVIFHMLMDIHAKAPETLDEIKKLCIDLCKEAYIYKVKASCIMDILNGKEIDISDQIKDYTLIDITYIDDNTVCIEYANEEGKTCIVAYSQTTSKKKSKQKAAYAVLKTISENNMSIKVGLLDKPSKKKKRKNLEPLSNEEIKKRYEQFLKGEYEEDD